MPIVDDGDIVRGIGFVAIYAAHLEECVDDVLGALRETGEKFDADIDRMPTSKKIRQCRAAIAELAAANPEMAILDAGLSEAIVLLTEGMT